MRSLIVIVFAVFLAVISGCGSVTAITPTKPDGLSELGTYEKVVVVDFENGSTCPEPETVKMRGEDFADRIAFHLRTTQAFREISRKQSSATGKSIVITGTITRYEEGDSSMRGAIGFGAGSSYFDADVVFKDNESGEQIATLKIDRNSWGLGGPIASVQTVHAYMDEAARKISKELKTIVNKSNKVALAQK
ncbi:MAG: DUF4410 domain-containing protein [Planctomycetota bacterium]|jgi:uncharacterized protein YceK